jgi:signal transduction histidine kinase
LAGLSTFFGSIRRRQMLLVGAFVLITAGTIIGLGYMGLSQSRERALESLMSQAAQLRQEILQAYIAQQKERVSLVASRTYLSRLMFRMTAPIETVAEWGMERPGLETFLDETSEILADAQRGSEGFDVISVADRDGIVLNSTDPHEVGRDYRDDEAYLSGNSTATFGEPRRYGRGRRTSLLAAPIEHDGFPAGVVLVTLDLAKLQELLNSDEYADLPIRTHVVRASETEGGEIIDLLGGSRLRLGGGRGGGHERSPAEEQLYSVMLGVLAGKTGYDGHHPDVLAAYLPVRDTDWGLVAAIDRSEASAVAGMKWWVTAIVPIILLLAVATTYGLARHMTRPIQELSLAARTLQSGDLTARAEVHTKDELGDLALAFNRMAHTLQGSQAELERRVEERTRQLARAKDEAERATRAKSEFMAIASHDLRNPLARVLGFARLLRRKVPEGEPMTDEGAEMLELVERGARSMQQIVEDYLELEAMRSGTMPLALAAVDVNALVRDTLRDMRPAADERRMTLEADLDPEAPEVPADRHRIGQVLQNLLDNALKYCAPYDEVTVRTRLVGENLFVEVSDTGPGVQPAEMTSLFERGTALTRPAGSGEKSTHMGLSVCRWILHLHCGEIGVRNNRGSGACFWFRLPLGEAARDVEGETTERRTP